MGSTKYFVGRIFLTVLHVSGSQTVRKQIVSIDSSREKRKTELVQHTKGFSFFWLSKRKKKTRIDQNWGSMKEKNLMNIPLASMNFEIDFWFLFWWREKVLKKFCSKEENLIYGLWRDVVSFRKEFVELKGNAERDLARVRSDISQTSRSLTSACLGFLAAESQGQVRWIETKFWAKTNFSHFQGQSWTRTNETWKSDSRPNSTNRTIHRKVSHRQNRVFRRPEKNQNFSFSFRTKQLEQLNEKLHRQIDDKEQTVRRENNVSRKHRKKPDWTKFFEREEINEIFFSFFYPPAEQKQNQTLRNHRSTVFEIEIFSWRFLSLFQLLFIDTTIDFDRVNLNERKRQPMNSIIIAKEREKSKKKKSILIEETH